MPAMSGVFAATSESHDGHRVGTHLHHRHRIGEEELAGGARAHTVASLRSLAQNEPLLVHRSRSRSRLGEALNVLRLAGASFGASRPYGDGEDSLAWMTEGIVRWELAGHRIAW